MSLLRHMRRIVPLAAVVPALCLFSCVNMKDGGVAATSGPGSSTFMPEAIKASPLSVSVEGASDAPTRWNLFDGNTHTAFAPAEAASLRVDLPRNMTITRLRVYGKSSYDVRVYRIEGANRSASPALTIRGEGLSGSWNTITPPEPFSADALVFAFAPVGEPALGVREIEIWSGESGEIPDEGVCSTLDAVKTPERLAAAISHGYPHIHELSAAPAELSIAANGGREHPGTMSFALAMPPVQVRRAFLRFKGKNLCAAPSVERRINGLSWSGGFPVPCDASDEWKEYFEEINPAWLAAGTNTVDFCSARDVSIKELSVVLVTGSGWNWISGVSERNAFDFDTQTSAGITIGHDMRIDFDSTVEPEHLLLHVPGPAHALARVQYLNNGSWRDIAGVWNVNCAGLVRGWNRLSFPAPVSADGIRLIFSAAPGGPAAPVEINEVRVAASPIAPRNAVRIVFDYPRNGEFYARSAYIRGFVATNGAISSLSLEGKTANADQTAPADGSFNVTLSKDETRYGAQKDDEPWDPALTALTGIGSFSSALHLYVNRLSSSSGSGSGSGSGPGSGTDGDGEQSDGSYRATLYPDQSKTILFRDVTLKFPAGSVTKTTVIRIVPLSQGEIPKLGEGMINVTYPAAGYRFLPSGKFEKPVEVYFRYTKDAMKAGQKDEDVFMYYYDVADGKWKRLERLAVEPAITMVTSQTDHFTDIINATLVVPEHPDPLSYNPNSIKDIKAGDPGAGINLIEPPTANSNGDVALSYPIEIPRGRNGMQPQIAVRYNSSGGNGWMGLGWDIPIQSVVIDTKFGVPRYNGSETYLLEGASIVPIGGNQYRQRTEGPFKRIMRRGDGPATYYWEVTDKNGTRFIYGQSAGSRLAASDGGNIFQWCLERVVDTNGNTIDYNYEIDNFGGGGEQSIQIYPSSISYSGYGGSSGPYSVNFIRDGGNRRDRIVNCRSGFKMLTRFLLSSIEVRYNGNIIRRYTATYREGKFHKTLLSKITQYGEGGTTVFNEHSFDYYNNVGDDNGRIEGFAGEQEWQNKAIPGSSDGFRVAADVYVGFSPFVPYIPPLKSGSFGVKVGADYGENNGRKTIIDIDGDGLPDFVYQECNFMGMCAGDPSYSPNKASPDGGEYSFGEAIEMEFPASNFSADKSYSFTFGVEANVFPGPGVYAHTNLGTSMTERYFADVDGDGLVDFVDRGQVYYNHGDGDFRSDGPPNFGDGYADLDGVDAGDFPGKDELAQDYYRDDPLRIWKAPYSGTIRITGEVRLIPKPDNEIAREYATDDGVHVSIQKGDSLLWLEAIGRNDADPVTPSNVAMVNVNAGDAIYFRVDSIDDGSYDCVEWDPLVEYIDEYNPTLKDENGLSVYQYQASTDFSMAGSGMYFNAKASGTALLAGVINKMRKTTDDVDVVIVQVNPVTLEELELYRRRIDASYIGNENVTLDLMVNGPHPETGVNGDMIKCYLRSDTPIDWSVVKWTPKVTYTSAYRPDGAPIEVTDGDGNPTMSFYAPVIIPLQPVSDYTGASAPYAPYEINRPGAHHLRVYYPINYIWPLPYDPDAIVDLGDFKANVTLAVKRHRNGEYDLVQKEVGIVQSVNEHRAVLLALTAEFEAEFGDELFFILSTDNAALFADNRIQVGLPMIYYGEEDPFTGDLLWGDPETYDSKVYKPLDGPLPFAGGFHSWYYGRYNGEMELPDHSMDISLIKLPDTNDPDMKVAIDIMNDPNSTDEQKHDASAAVGDSIRDYSMMIQDIARIVPDGYETPGEGPRGLWIGNDSYKSKKDKTVESGDTWISATMMSSTRVGQKYLTPDTTSPIPGGGSGAARGRAVTKFTRSNTYSAGASYIVSGNISYVHSNTYTDYIDMNGDRYPDIITDSGIQYTNPNGSMGNRESALDTGEGIQEIESVNLGFGFSFPLIDNSPSSEKIVILHSGCGVSAGASATTQQISDKPSLGLSGNAGYGESRTRSMFVDVNGDGLPDLVTSTGDTTHAGSSKVKLNLGYGFGAEEDLHPSGDIRLNRTFNMGAGLGLAFDKGGFGFGLNINASISATEVDYIDINGDGLPDRVERRLVQNGLGGFNVLEVYAKILSGDIFDATSIDLIHGSEPIYVDINTGDGFADSIEWHGSSDGIPLSLDVSFSESLAGYVEFFIPIITALPPFYNGSIIINPGANGGMTQGLSMARMMDLDGDGNVDQVFTDAGGAVVANLNNTGKTNLLKSVSRPLGGSFSVDYRRVGNTKAMPQSRWVLSTVTVNDGMPADESVHSYTTSYRINDGFYNKVEREFCGFGEVTETRADGSVHTRHYFNDFYRKGLEKDTIVRDAAGNLYSATVTTYGSTPIVENQSYFTYVSRKNTYYYEGTTKDTSASPKWTYQTYEYDQYGNVTRFTDYGEPGDADNLTAVIAYSYSPDSHIVAKPKLMTVTGGDGREYRKRAGAYDSLGNLRKISQYLDGGGIAETNIDYYPNGNLMRVTAPVNSRGQRYTENYAYDGAVGVYIEEIRDSHGYASYAKYDYRYGVPVSTADINGQNTLYQYDEFGRLRAVYGPYDIGQGSPTIRVSYHTSSSPAWALVRNKGYWESNDTVNTVTVIDGLKRVIQVKKTAEVMKDGEKQSGMIISGKEVYDALGRVERQGQPVFVPGADQGYTPVSARRPTEYAYDVMGRKTRIAFPDGTSIANLYGFEDNMFLTRTTDQEGKIKKVLKDVQGQIVTVKEGPGEDETNYEYNPMNEIERVIDADLNVTEIDYDNLGRRISINNPDAGLVEYNYDQAGNLIRKITPNLRRDGKYIRYIYYFNHLERIDYPGMANTYYTYGSAGADGNGAGRIVAVDNGVLREKRAYGRLGELVRTDRTIAGTTYTTKYEFDSMGRMRRMVFPDSETLVYAYDRGGLLRHAATHENGIINTYLKDIGYDEFGQRVQVKYGNDAVSTYEYDDTTRRLMHLKTVNKDGTVFQNIEYAYDRVGNILSKKNSNFMTSSGDAKTSEQTYAYDDLHRLTSSNGTFSKESWLPFFTNRTNTYTNSFTYNSIGNILNKNQVNKGRFDDGSEVTIAPTTYTFDYEYGSFRPHAVTKAGTKTFTYDLNGNMLTQVDTASGLNRNIAWDDENRITSTNDSGTVTSYAYDDKGERVIKNGKFGNVVYVNNNFAVRNGTLKSKHIFAGNTRLASKLVDAGTDRGTYYYHADHLGSSNAITNKTGGFHEHIEYFPYGETWVEEKAAGGVELGYKFTAKELDPETGLYYFGQRTLDPVPSIWTTVDKYLEKYLPTDNGDFDTDHNFFYHELHEKASKLPGHGGVFNTVNLNLYHYAGNNPVKYVDPDGNAAHIIVPVAIAVVAVIITTQEFSDGTQKRDSKYGESSAQYCKKLAGNIFDLVSGKGELNALKKGGALILSARGTQDKRLSDGEIKNLKKQGLDIHEIKKDALKSVGKGKEPVSRYDLFKDSKGEVLVKPKNGQGEGISTGIKTK